MNFKRYLAGIALAASVPLSASAAIVTLDGDYFDVSYDDALVGLFGTPMIVGDAIKFFPSGNPGFTAKTTTSDTTIITNSTIALSITADAGWTLTGGSLWEAGDYLVFGGGSVVAATGQLRMTPLDPSGSTLIDPITASNAFVPATFPNLATTNWEATAGVTLDDAANSANVSIQNILVAYAGGDAGPKGAFIEKKEVVLTVGVAPIPEPATWATMATGAILLGFALRRSRA